MLSSKTNIDILTNLQKKKEGVIRLYDEINHIENEAENEKLTLRYDINKTRIRDWHKYYTKYKIYISKIVVICNKQHLSNIWSWIHEIQTIQY